MINHFSGEYVFFFSFSIFLESSSNDKEEEAVISSLNISQPDDKSILKKQGSIII